MGTKLTVIILKLVVMMISFGQSGFQSTQSSVPIPFWDIHPFLTPASPIAGPKTWPRRVGLFSLICHNGLNVTSGT